MCEQEQERKGIKQRFAGHYPARTPSYPTSYLFDKYRDVVLTLCQVLF